MSENDDEFELFDLKVEVIGESSEMVCSHAVGDHFLVRGENLFFPGDRGFSLYALAALLPLLPAKQRNTHKNDWMTTDEVVACPDPNCGGQFLIRRTGFSRFKHSKVTVAPIREKSGRKRMDKNNDSNQE